MSHESSSNASWIVTVALLADHSIWTPALSNPEKSGVTKAVSDQSGTMPTGAVGEGRVIRGGETGEARRGVVLREGKPLVFRGCIVNLLLVEPFACLVRMVYGQC